MKGLKILLLLIVVLAVGCKTQKIAPKPQPAVVEETIKTTVPEKPKAPAVTAKEEKVSAAQGEAADFGSKRFYVILGSFGVYENAQNFKKQLMAEDFFPGILVNENGLYRVSVNSFDDESTARSRVAEIRQKFPKYNDVWLLIKKQ